MDERFTIAISPKLLHQLVDGGEKLKKKTKKPKAKVPREPKRFQTKVPQNQISDDSETLKGPAAGWPLQPPVFLPVPPPQTPANTELDAIRSVLQDSEKVLERLQKQEETMLQEVTQRAKELHEKEFKLPEQKPLPCLEERDACLKCYKENITNPLKCANLVNNFANCAREVRHNLVQQISNLL